MMKVTVYAKIGTHTYAEALDVDKDIDGTLTVKTGPREGTVYANGVWRTYDFEDISTEPEDFR